MMRYAKLGLPVLMFWSAWLSAAEVSTSVTTISHEGVNQLLGSFTIKIDDNAFPSASFSTPIYIRFQLAEANGWSKTLVDLRDGAHDSVRRPINIALYPSSGGTIDPLVPPTAVQLVRLIEGEQEGWLRVSYPTNQWVNDLGSPGAPSANNEVSVRIGITGGNSVQPGANTPSGGNEAADTGHLIGTLLRADYFDTPFFGIGDVEQINFLAFDETTSGVETGSSVIKGADTGVGFSNDPSIARGEAQIPCFEYHTEADDFDSPPHQLGINRMNLYWRDLFCAKIPIIYLTNSSDFEWYPGSQFFLTPKWLDPSYLVEDRPEPNFTIPHEKIELGEAPPRFVNLSHGTTWSFEEVHYQGALAGWRMTLVEGFFPIFGQISIEDINICTEGWFDGAAYTMRASAYFIHPTFSRGGLQEIAPITKRAAVLDIVPEDYHRQVMPYTGFDRPDWERRIRFVNPNPEPARFTAFLYQRQGIHMRTMSLEKIPPYGSVTFDPVALYDSNFARILTWVEVLSDQPLTTVGVAESFDKQTFDIFSGIGESREILNGPHVPDNGAIWQSNAYVVASEFDTDSSFELRLPGGVSDLKALRAPRSSTVLDDEDFNSILGRGSWFQVQATAKAASGVFFFERRDNGSQLASISLNEQPAREWSFTHLGNTNEGWWNGLIFFNPGSSTTVTIQALGPEGEPLGESDISVPGESRIVDLAEAIVPVTNASRIQLTAHQEIVAGLLIGRQDQEILTHVPGNLPLSERLLLPFVPAKEGRWLGLAITNGIRFTSNRGTITPFTADGTAGPVQSFNIGPDAKELILLENLEGYTHLIIESNDPISVFGLTGNPGQLATVPVRDIR